MIRAFVISLFTLPILAAAPPLDYDQARGLMEQYCQACHGGKSSLGGFNLDRYPDLAAVHAAPDKWHAAAARLRDHDMPPKGALGPDPDDRQRLVDFLQSTLRQAACAEGPIPGPTVVRRLNRSEYAATIRDLLDVHFNAGAGLPADGAGGEGFDNAAETLFLSPIHAEKYLEAAREALSYAYGDRRSRERLLLAQPDETTSPEAAARKILTWFLPRAFRRPVVDAEIETYMGLFSSALEEGETFDAAVLYALQGVLISPHFLFLVEAPNLTPEPQLLSDFELASRVSYLLWGSMPDDELFQMAERGVLQDPAQIEGKVLCMLEDERTREFSERFVEQWLGTRELGRDIQPDPELFPEFKNFDFRAAVRYEPILFFDELLKSGGTLLNLIDSDWTIAGKDLVKHYEMPPIKGLRENPLRIELPPDSHRGGLLGMASILAVSSLPTRTSPVLRGKWVLENLLGLPPPPPPPNVPELEESHEGAAPKSMRERLEQHRSNPTCASCHDRIDPIGFGLENFDVLGRWRTEDGGAPIDSSGVLPDGSQFSGPEELKQILLERKDLVMRNLVEKMLGYALGRGLTLEDACAVDQIMDRLRAREYNAHTLMLEVIRSKPFRYKAGSRS